MAHARVDGGAAILDGLGTLGFGHVAIVVHNCPPKGGTANGYCLNLDNNDGVERNERQ